MRDARRPPDERGAALVTVLVLIVLLTVIGAAMVTASLTEITIAFNQGDAAAALQMAEAGIAQAADAFRTNAAWGGTGGPVTLGDGSYNVTVVATGTMRFITSIGTRGGGQQQLRAALEAVPHFAGNTVVANTTATIGSGVTGLTVSNTLPSINAGAVHANNRLGAGTAMTVNTTGTTIIGSLTANGTISGVTCGTWPWRCDPAFGVLPLPRLDVDSAAASSFKTRARTTTDPADGLNLYFHGGDATSRCMSGGAWNFSAAETQRCWDKYVSDHSGSIGQTISSAVFFVEFNANEHTSYTASTTAIAFRAAASAASVGNPAVGSITIAKPAGVVDNDVMIAAIAARRTAATTTTITPPLGWTSVRRIDNANNLVLEVFRKVASGEGASYTFSLSPTARVSGGIVAYSGVDTVEPIDVENGQFSASPSSTHSTPSITTTIADTMLVASFAAATGRDPPNDTNNWDPPPAGMTGRERYDLASGGPTTSARASSAGYDQLQAAIGVPISKTGTLAGGPPAPTSLGAAHILALRRIAVHCVDHTRADETLCIRSRPATDSLGTVVYPNSDVRQVTGTVVAFRRGSGTTVVGDVALENLSLRTANYTHRNFTTTGDPAFVAGGRFRIISSGSSGSLRTVEVTGIIYTLAGTDNPDVNNNLQGSAGLGVEVQHGADLVNITLNGFLLSNGSITLQDTAANSGGISVLYDAAVADNLPAVFTASSVDNVIFQVSWSSGK